MKRVEDKGKNITFRCMICLNNYTHDEVVHGKTIVFCLKCYSKSAGNILEMLANSKKHEK